MYVLHLFVVAVQVSDVICGSDGGFVYHRWLMVFALVGDPSKDRRCCALKRPSVNCIPGMSVWKSFCCCGVTDILYATYGDTSATQSVKALRLKTPEGPSVFSVSNFRLYSVGCHRGRLSHPTLCQR